MFRDDRLAHGGESSPICPRRKGIAVVIEQSGNEKDWPLVAEARKASLLDRPAFGLHPWHVKDRSPDWLAS
ncbi:MAG: hypothetical protein R3F13_18115 [Prosthecobacter sp.]